jgi:hypothetical protein
MTLSQAYSRSPLVVICSCSRLSLLVHALFFSISDIDNEGEDDLICALDTTSAALARNCARRTVVVVASLLCVNVFKWRTRATHHLLFIVYLYLRQTQRDEVNDEAIRTLELSARSLMCYGFSKICCCCCCCCCLHCCCHVMSWLWLQRHH